MDIRFIFRVLFLGSVISCKVYGIVNQSQRDVWDLPRHCYDCAFGKEVCGFKEYCKIINCITECKNISLDKLYERRPPTCDKKDDKRTNPRDWECFDETMYRNCHYNERCCHTGTGSYCSTGVAQAWKFPGQCSNCSSSRQVCGITKPCTLENCKSACIDFRSFGDEKRPSTCDITQNKRPNVYQCLEDGYCEENERCCFTTTGSYCSRDKAERYQQVFSKQLQMCEQSCEFDKKICDLKQPCEREQCKIECVYVKSHGIWFDNRPETCDPLQNNKPNIYECLHDTACLSYQKCCHTDTGSYCSTKHSEKFYHMRYMSGSRLCISCHKFQKTCGLKKPCRSGACELGCVDFKSRDYGFRNIVCDARQNTQPTLYQCAWNTDCKQNERCCFTATGSYCSK